ncbi:transposase, partial [Thermodesulfobacteriota bacterium]
ELTGGGLVRSLGGWSEIRAMRRQGQDHVMSDERILGDSAFVEAVLSRADEQFERHYDLKRRGYDLVRIAEKVAKIYGMKPDEVFLRGKQPRKVKARSPLCFWAVRELGISLRELAKRLEMSSPGVGFAVERGEAIAHENNYHLAD